MRSPSILLSLLVSLPCTACLDQLVDEPQTEQSEAFVPAQPLPLEGSATAYGMLRVVNERSFLELDEVLGLDRRAAQSIMSYRAGEDRYPGTDDDRYFSTLAALDDQYWLGEQNLWTIQRHALLEGYVPAEPLADGCASSLVAAIDACIEHTAALARTEPSTDVLVAACLEQSEPEAPSSEHFAAAGLPAYHDPWLGYFGLLCTGETPDPICALGVAGIADRLGPSCDALYDSP
ncbi:MAG: hypothetical protein H6712_31790 [Myxococcales bacterium]|nr:hypothetical protein [Myxococcales bacterium]